MGATVLHFPRRGRHKELIWPVEPIGLRDGWYVYEDVTGRVRELTFAEHDYHGLIALFRGDLDSLVRYWPTCPQRGFAVDACCSPRCRENEQLRPFCVQRAGEDLMGVAVAMDEFDGGYAA